jgi:uncharacterized protein with HEPN domain
MIWSPTIQLWIGHGALGNLLRHEYHFIDHKQIWSIATEKLPELAPTIDAMIAANRTQT